MVKVLFLLVTYGVRIGQQLFKIKNKNKKLKSKNEIWKLKKKRRLRGVVTFRPGPGRQFPIVTNSVRPI